MKPTLKSLLASLALGAMSATSADAAVIVTLPTPSVAGSIVFTQDINFTITTAGNVAAVIFDEWVTSDGAENTLSGSSLSPNFSYSLNGGATATAPWLQFSDNLSLNFNAVTPNDGYVELSAPITTTLGNVFTLKAATYTLAANSLPAGFNPQAAQTFTGSAFLTTNIGVRLSANTSVGAVPEPSRALLLLCGLSTLALRRRK